MTDRTSGRFCGSILLIPLLSAALACAGTTTTGQDEENGDLSYTLSGLLETKPVYLVFGAYT
jgi:hypothetical protein